MNIGVHSLCPSAPLRFKFLWLLILGFMFNRRGTQRLKITCYTL